jgi:hypothetical protein
MRTLVVVRPKKTTLLRRPTLHMVVMIEGPPLFGAWCQRGSELTIYPCGVVCILSLVARLSIYLRLWTCMNYLCGVMDGDVVNLEPFKICKA